MTRFTFVAPAAIPVPAASDAVSTTGERLTLRAAAATQNTSQHTHGAHDPALVHTAWIDAELAAIEVRLAGYRNAIAQANHAMMVQRPVAAPRDRVSFIASRGMLAATIIAMCVAFFVGDHFARHAHATNVVMNTLTSSKAARRARNIHNREALQAAVLQLGRLGARVDDLRLAVRVQPEAPAASASPPRGVPPTRRNVTRGTHRAPPPLTLDAGCAKNVFCGEQAP